MTGPEDTTRPERAPDPHRVEHELDPRDVAGAYDVLELEPPLCPYCGRVMTFRERGEQGACNDCYDR